MNRDIGYSIHPRILDISTILAVMGTVGVGLWTWYSVNDHSMDLADDKIHRESLTNTSDTNSTLENNLSAMTTADRSMNWDESIWHRPLQFGFRQRSVTAEKSTMLPDIPTAPTVAETSMPVPHLGLRLLGTVLERDHSMLIAMDRSGRLDFRRAGTILELEPSGIHIDTISKGSAQVTYQGKSREWRLGEYLTFEVETSAAGQQTAGPNSAPKQRMSIEEELDRINRPPSNDR